MTNRLVIPAALFAVNLAFRGKSTVATIAETAGLSTAETLDILAGAGFTPDAFGFPRQTTTSTDRRPPMTQPLPVNHSDKRIAALAKKIRTDQAHLATLVQAYESTAAARNEVARLEAELAAAKAKLRGGKPAAVASVTPYNSAEVRRWANDNGVPVPKAGIVPKAVVQAYLAATA